MPRAAAYGASSSALAVKGSHSQWLQDRQVSALQHAHSSSKELRLSLPGCRQVSTCSDSVCCLIQARSATALTCLPLQHGHCAEVVAHELAPDLTVRGFPAAQGLPRGRQIGISAKCPQQLHVTQLSVWSQAATAPSLHAGLRQTVCSSHVIHLIV